MEKKGLLRTGKDREEAEHAAAGAAYRTVSNAGLAEWTSDEEKRRLFDEILVIERRRRWLDVGE